MAKVTGNSAKAAAVVGFLIICCGIPITTCGVIWVAYNGYYGHGLWSGIPLLLTGFLGFLSLTRNNTVFTLYVVLAVLTSIGAGIQAVTAGLELMHWDKYIGNNKCSVVKGACTCIGYEKIRIDDLDTCDKIPTINDLFITIIFFSVLGSLLCLGGAIAGCVGLASVPRSQPTTLPRKPKSKEQSSTLTLERNSYYPANDVKKADTIDNRYPESQPKQPYGDRRDDYYYNKPQRDDYEKERYYDDRRDDRKGDYYENDRYRDDRRDDRRDDYYDRDRRDDYYDRDRYRDDRRDDYYDKDRYRDDRRDDYYDRDRRDDYDRYSDRSYGRDSYDRRSYDRDSYDDRRSEGRKTPTYL